MRRRNTASFASPTYVARDTSSVSWGYFVLTVVCTCVVAAGFFLAARQHFNTMDYGFQNGRLRKQVEDLQTERRRLLLAREISMSPAEIKRAAKNLGFRDRGEVALVAAKSPIPASSASTTIRTTNSVSTPSRVSDTSKPVKTFYPESKKADSTDSSVKKIVMQKSRRIDDNRLVAAVR